MPLVSGLLLVLLCVVQRAVCDCAASAHTSDSQESGSGAPTCTSAGSTSSAGGDAEAASSSPPQLPREAAIFGVEVPGDATPQKPANAKKPVYKLQIGVKRRAPAESCVRRAQPGDMLSVNFTGWLYESGAEFDRSAALYGFRLGDHQVISGWEIGLTGACVGELRRLVIPAYLAFGDAGRPGKVPGKAAVVYEIELLRLERPPADKPWKSPEQLAAEREKEETPPGEPYDPDTYEGPQVGLSDALSDPKQQRSEL